MPQLRAPTSSSTRSTPSSGRSPRRCAARCGCWRAPAPARPGRSPTGSPTASPRGLQPARGARGHLHHPCGGRDARPAARASAPAACRPARSTPPRCGRRGSSGRGCTAASCPTLTESKLGADRQRRPAQPRSPTDQATLRDLASEVEWAKVSNVRPDDYAADRRGARPRGRRPRRRDASPGCSRRYEEVKREPGPDGHGGRAAVRRRPCSPRTSGSPPRSAGSTSGSSSTSSRTSARSSPRCSTCGSAGATSSASWATRPRRSTPSPAPSAAYLLRLPARSSRGTTSVELVRNYRSTPAGGRRGQPPARRHRQRRRAAALAAGGRRRGRLRASTPTRWPRPSAVADAVGPLHRRRHARRARSRCCSGSTPSPRRSRRRWPPAASPTSSAARPGSSTAPRCGRRSRCCAAQRARGGGRPAPAWSTGVARRAGRHGLDRPAADRPRQTSATGGSRCRRSSPWREDSAPAEPAPTLGDFVDELDRRAARAARAGRRGRHAGDAARRQGPRVGRRLPGRHARGHDADRLRRRRPAAVEEERRLLYVGMTRARAPARRSPGRWRATPGGRASRKPSRFLAGLRPAGASDAAARARRAASRRTVAHCRECGKPLAHDGGAQDRPLRRTARRPTTRSCSSGCAPGGGARRRRRGCRRTSCSPTRRCRRSPRSSPDGPQALLRINGIGAGQARPSTATRLPRRCVAGRADRVGLRPSVPDRIPVPSRKYPKNRLPLTGRHGTFSSSDHDPAHPGPDKARARQHQGGDRSDQHHLTSQHVDLGMPVSGRVRVASLRAFPMTTAARPLAGVRPRPDPVIAGYRLAPASPSPRVPSRGPPPGVRRSR